MNTNTDHLAMIMKAIPWFESVGMPVAKQEIPIVCVDSWELAIAVVGNRDSGRFRLESRNDMYFEQFQNTRQLMTDKEQNQEFTRTLIPIKAIIEEQMCLLGTKLPPDISSSVRDSVRWMLLMCGVYLVFKARIHRITIYRHVLSLFEQGHFVCGWQGRYPIGQLVVF